MVQVDPKANLWPDLEALVRAWLVSNLTGVNVRTETDSTFGSPSPSTAMALPLVLIQRVPGGSLDPEWITEEATIDVDCFAKTRADVWPLAQKVNALMLGLADQPGSYGVIDEVDVENGVGLVNYSNPDMRRTTAAYRLATRAQASI